MNVTFAPLAPGLRTGAVEIVDGSGKVLANTYIYGGAIGPAIGFDPSNQLSLVPQGSGFLPYNDAIAVDGSGNVFVPDGPTTIGEIVAVHGIIPPNPTINPIARGFKAVVALAMDGSGNIFVCDAGDRAVKEIMAAGGYTTIKTIASGLLYPYGIAVDRNGNVFVAITDFTAPDGSVDEILAVNGGIPVNPTINAWGGFDGPQSVAVDGNDNVFVVDMNDTAVPSYSVLKEILAVNGSLPANPTINTLASGQDSPYGVAVDGNGNVFVAGFYQGVTEILAVNGSVPPNPTVNTLDTGFKEVLGIAADRNGNLFISGVAPFAELQRSLPRSLSFAPTNPGYTSSDSPQSVRIENIGNSPLLATALTVSFNWDLVAGSGTPADCTASFSLTPGAECNLSISFEPTEDGPLTGAATIVDNSLNASGSTQSIPLNGTGFPLQISSVSHTYGAAYSWVNLTGVNFGPSQGSSTVSFNGIPAPIYRWSNTLIWSTVPPDATTGNIVVTVHGEASNAIPFTVLPMPMLTGISPSSGPVGTVVTLSGANLLDYENKGTVTFNGKSLPILSQSSTALKVAIPAGAVTGDFHVLVNDTGINTPVFTVTP